MITNAISAYRAGQSPSNKPQNQNFKGAREVALVKTAVAEIVEATNRTQSVKFFNAQDAFLQIRKAVYKIYNDAGFTAERMSPNGQKQDWRFKKPGEKETHLVLSKLPQENLGQQSISDFETDNELIVSLVNSKLVVQERPFKPV